MSTAETAGSALRPPYPLTRLEQRALDSGQWVLVRNAADQRVYFFNPSNRQATRHLQPMLLGAERGVPPMLAPTSAVLPASRVSAEEDTVASLRAKLHTSEEERLKANDLVERLQREVLLLRYATLARKTSHDGSSPPVVNPAVSRLSMLADNATLSLLHGTPRRALSTATAAADLLTSPIEYPSHAPLTLSPQRLATMVPTETTTAAAAASPHASTEVLHRTIGALEKQVEALTRIHLELLTRVQLQ